jgi:hypothetical protein
MDVHLGRRPVLYAAVFRYNRVIERARSFPRSFAKELDL